MIDSVFHEHLPRESVPEKHTFTIGTIFDMSTPKKYFFLFCSEYFLKACTASGCEMADRGGFDELNGLLL